MAKRKPAAAAPLDRIERLLTLTAQVEDRLRRAVAQGKFPGGRLPTIVTLAEQLGVSRETVRLALDSLEQQGLVVKHRRRGTFLHVDPLPAEVESTTRFVGYLQADYGPADGGMELVTGDFSHRMLEGALAAARSAGYQVVVANARIADLRQAYDQLSGQVRLSGVIFASVAEAKLLRRIVSRNLPVVLLDHDLHLPKLSSIQPDSFGGAKLAVSELARLGHQRIALAQWHEQDLNTWLLRGYREGLRLAGLPRRRSWEQFVPITPAGAAEVVSALQKISPRPTAILCFNNALASFVIDAAHAQGLRVPEDLSVVGGGGGDIPGLACAQLDWRRLGSAAMELLLTAMKSGERFKPEHQLMAYEFRTGRTMAPPDA